MNIIKYALVKLVAKITGRKCSRCDHNRAGRCCHPNGRTFMRCWQSLTRPGFKERCHQGSTMPALTDEERHQLQRIKCTLDDAAEMARESGLLTED